MHIGVGFPVPRHRFLNKTNANKDRGGVPAAFAELFAAFLHPLDSHPKRLLPIVGGYSKPSGRMQDVGLGGSTRQCHLRRSLVVDHDLNLRPTISQVTTTERKCIHVSHGGRRFEARSRIPAAEHLHRLNPRYPRRSSRPSPNHHHPGGLFEYARWIQGLEEASDVEWALRTWPAV